MSTCSIYLICAGTTNNDIIQSVNECIVNKSSKKENLSLFSFFTGSNASNNISVERISKLEKIGVQELLVCKEHNKDILNNKNVNIFTSMDYHCIESALILFSDVPEIIYPIPNIGITKIKNVASFKNYFGLKRNTTKKINYRDYNLVNPIQSILNWEYITMTQLNGYNYNAFKNNFSTFMIKYSFHTSTNIIVCTSKFILDMIKKCTKRQYNKEEDIIYKSSIWRIDIIDENMKIDYFERIYPIKQKMNYILDNEKFTLFEENKKIPCTYIKNMHRMTFSTLTSNKQHKLREKIKEIITSMYNHSTKKNINKNHNKNHNNIHNKIHNRTEFPDPFPPLI